MLTYSIVGYTYQADNFAPDSLIEHMIVAGELSPGARGMGAEAALDQLANGEGVNREDERTFDSGDFPKVIFEDRITCADRDWYADAPECRIQFGPMFESGSECPDCGLVNW